MAQAVCLSLNKDYGSYSLHLVVLRLGSFVPIPGIDAAVLAQFFEQQKGTIVEMFNMFSGGALERASVLALGIMPYISASIIMQLLTVMTSRNGRA